MQQKISLWVKGSSLERELFMICPTEKYGTKVMNPVFVSNAINDSSANAVEFPFYMASSCYRDNKFIKQQVVADLDKKKARKKVAAGTFI